MPHLDIFFGSTLKDWFDGIEDMATNASVSGPVANNAFTLKSANFGYGLGGTGITFDHTGFTGGTVNSILAGTATGLVISDLEKLNLSVVAMENAFVQDATGVNDHAVEDLFFGLGYNIRCAHVGNDVLLASDKSADGVSYNLTGNDTVLGFGGDDNLWLSDGNDLLEGGKGNDSLYGGNGNDTLVGGLGTGVLNGGNGDDLIISSTRRDVETGGAGTDTFQFAYAFGVGSGHDKITDFDPATDRIHLSPGTSHAFVDAGNSVIMTYGDLNLDQVLLVGVTMAEVASIVFV